ncbi:MAG TPA: SWIM zinc finger family protein [Gemmataceae bacterium]|jgi:uncharacterized Zn finger protein|nr:SWIM zinc finger family protein [Gemmataceae bacterium]
MWYRREWYFPRSRPRQAKGGIKAQSKRGGFGQSWWAQRWIAVLESFDIGARLGRGRSYARNGQVLSIDIDKGLVKARVQGSRPKPYDIQINVNVLPAADWKKLERAVAGQALFAAKLLAGEMPQDIEQAFTGAGLSLFPEKLRDLTTSCSCPDWSNPCKHIAAVYYLLGEEFDRDPFVLFKLRGLSREELIAHLGAGAAEGRAVPPRKKAKRPAQEPEAAAPPEPLPADAATFWNGRSLPEDWAGDVQVPPVAAAVPKRLGNFPFWRGQARFLDALEPVYGQASPCGLDVFLGESGPGRGVRAP